MRGAFCQFIPLGTFLQKATNVQTILDTETLPAASTAFVANEGPSRKKVYKLEELIGKDAKVPFKLVPWDGK